MRDIRVAFGGLHAVDGVSIDLYPGEVVALVGGNGAGKSTLMHTLSGAHPADSGEILINGEPVTIHQPRDAQKHGIETIYQKLALAENIDAAGNVFLGRELRTRTGRARRLGHGVGDPEGRSGGSTRGSRTSRPRCSRSPADSGNRWPSPERSTSTPRSSSWTNRPPPSARPRPTQVRDLVTQLKSEGIGIFLISHDIHDVFDLADRISVMLQGKLVGTVNKHDVTKDEVLAMIIMGKKPGEVSSEDMAELHN